MAKPCGSCGRQLEVNARFCSGCGQRLPEEPPNTASPTTSPGQAPTEQQDLVKFLGPSSEYYLQQFASFQRSGSDRFALTWNWYPFLFGWLWFLYRKMYLYAAAFAVGPFLILGLLRGGGMIEILLMWGIAAGGLANYLYYGHVLRSLNELRSRIRIPGETWDQALSDVGGVQPYVWWLGAGVLIMALVLGIMNPPPDEPPPNQPALLEDV